MSDVPAGMVEHPMQLAGMKHGETRTYTAEGGRWPIEVSYHQRQSHGDSGARVPGAYTGEYTVHRVGGHDTTHEHGPYATTEGAAKRGASRDSKLWAASQAETAMKQHWGSKRMGFHDRREA